MLRKIKIRFRVLRNNVEYAELYPVGSPTLCMNRTASIKTSLKGSFRIDAVNARGEVVNVNWLTDEIQPVLIIDGVEYSLAVVMPAAVTPTKDENRETVSVEAYDRCWRISDVKTESLLHLSAGSNYITVIENLLVEAGITMTMKTMTTAELTEDREDWEIGTPYLDIINQLLSEINYESLWFNASGIAMLKPAQELIAENVKITFTDRDVDPRDPKAAKIKNVLPEITQTSDIFKAANVFVCVCSNPDKEDVMIATAENNNPQSPLSIMRRGRRIVSVQNIDNIASQEELQAYADKIRNESMITGEIYNVKTLLLPNINTSDVVALQLGESGSICVEEQWEMVLGVGGTMSHTLNKVVANLG